MIPEHKTERQRIIRGDLKKINRTELENYRIHKYFFFFVVYVAMNITVVHY